MADQDKDLELGPIGGEVNNTEEAKGKKKFKLKLFLGSVFIVAAISLTGGFIVNNNHEKMIAAVQIESIYNNIFIDNVDVGGMTREEAKQSIISQVATPAQSKKITLKNNGKTFDFTLKDFGLAYNVGEAVEEAYQFARVGKLRDRYNQVIDLKESPHVIKLAYEYDPNLITENISVLAEEVYVEPVNATMVMADGGFNITNGVDGAQMDIEKTVAEVRKLVDSLSGGEATIVTEPIKPTYTAEDFQMAQTLIGSASTYYSGRGSGRVVNMEVAASKINGYVLYPGEIFSTNKEFGPSTYENGYMDAPVIENGELIEGIGGGVCQVSSTLYNAILRAELEVVERRNHSLKVGYVDWGFDSTLAGDYIDLKFRNDTDLPLFVEAYLSADRVVCNIYGKEIHGPGRTLEFVNALVDTTPPGAEKLLTPKLCPQGKGK
ncbi:MAG: VanW family protein [Clostridiales bacterium]|jgi:vancomycin resistance protein YoaR|nr:VanW family protein [Clostridiales bacterium]